MHLNIYELISFKLLNWVRKKLVCSLNICVCWNSELCSVVRLMFKGGNLIFEILLGGKKTKPQDVGFACVWMNQIIIFMNRFLLAIWLNTVVTFSMTVTFIEGQSFLKQSRFFVLVNDVRKRTADIWQSVWWAWVILALALLVLCRTAQKREQQEEEIFFFVFCFFPFLFFLFYFQFSLARTLEGCHTAR